MNIVNKENFKKGNRKGRLKSEMHPNNWTL